MINFLKLKTCTNYIYSMDVLHFGIDFWTKRIQWYICVCSGQWWIFMGKYCEWYLLQTGWPNRKIWNVHSFAIAMQFGIDFWVNWVFELWKKNQITTKRSPISNLELYNMHKVCTTLPWVHDQKQYKRKVSKTETDRRKRQASSLPHSKLCHSWSINHLDPVKRKNR